MASQEPASLTSLPNEVLWHVLIPLRTSELVPLASLCHRFHDLVVRIVSIRVRLAACLHPQSLLLEAYHPSQRLTEPPYPCVYLGTDGLDDGEPYEEPIGGLTPGQRLRELGEMYSKYRPHRRQIEKINPMRHPAGDVPGSRTFNTTRNNTASDVIAPNSSAVANGSSRAAEAAEASIQNTYEPVIQQAHLEAGVRFTQLCADTTVISAGPTVSLFSGHQHVEKGVVRVFRDWLAEHATLGTGNRAENDELVAEDGTGDDSERAPLGLKHDRKGKAPKDQRSDVRADQGVLWVGNRHSVGIRFGVRQPKWRPQYNPILVRADEELPVSYEIEYEELLVRTVDLLLASEKVVDKQLSNYGKAIVIGSFPK